MIRCFVANLNTGKRESHSTKAILGYMCKQDADLSMHGNVGLSKDTDNLHYNLTFILAHLRQMR